MYLLTGEPKNITIKRLFVDDNIHDDRFAVIQNGEQIGEIGHVKARLFWLGRVSLRDLLNGDNETAVSLG